MSLADNKSNLVASRRLAAAPAERRRREIIARTVSQQRQIDPEITGARMSAQAHTLIARAEILQLVEEELSHGYEIIEEAGLYKVRLKHSLYSSAVSGLQREAWERYGRQLPPSTAQGTQHGRTFGLLSKTSKMGCYSFNLPAAPSSLYGTCPASALGLYLVRPEEQLAARRGLIAQVAPTSIRERDFLCGGCYAMKGAYGNPSQLLKQSIIYAVTVDLLKTGDFVSVMVEAIQSARRKSDRQLRRAPVDKRYTVPHPDYFRIHDSGDFFTPEYWRAWREIMQALPDVHFWAPTRMWALKGGACGTMRSQAPIPDNLALRPSALHFGDPAPSGPLGTPAQGPEGRGVAVEIPGMAAGSGSAKKNEIPDGVFPCPAYKLQSEGGGADPVLKEGRTLTHSTGEPLTQGGNCGRARGLDPERERPMSEQGAGCRACWLHKELPIYYQEH